MIENLLSEMSMISSSDAAKFLFWIANQSFSGPINAASIGHPPIGEILEMIAAKTGKKLNIHSKGEDAACTPFIGGESSYLDVAKATGLGFEFSQVKDWLSGLIDYWNR